MGDESRGGRPQPSRPYGVVHRLVRSAAATPSPSDILRTVIDLDATLAPLGPLFSSAEASAQGLSAKVLRRAVASGLVRRLAPGHYAVVAQWEARSPQDQHLLLARAAQRQRPWAVVSHLTAAALHGLPLPSVLPPTVALTTDHDTGTANGGIARLEPAALPGSAVTTRDGLTATTVVRTVVDCLRTLPLPDGVAMVDAALAAGVVTLPDLERERAFQKGWPWIGVADCALWLADPVRESWFESVSFAQLWLDGIPVPQHQATVLDHRDRFVARVDGIWLDRGVVGEADGSGKYLGRYDSTNPDPEVAARVVLEEKRREDRLGELGLEVVRWSPTDGLVDRADRVRWALSRSGRRFAGTVIPADRSRHAWRTTVDEPPRRTGWRRPRPS